MKKTIITTLAILGVSTSVMANSFQATDKSVDGTTNVSGEAVEGLGSINPGAFIDGLLVDLGGTATATGNAIEKVAMDSVATSKATAVEVEGLASATYNGSIELTLEGGQMTLNTEASVKNDKKSDKKIKRGSAGISQVSEASAGIVSASPSYTYGKGVELVQFLGLDKASVATKETVSSVYEASVEEVTFIGKWMANLVIAPTAHAGNMATVTVGEVSQVGHIASSNHNRGEESYILAVTSAAGGSVLNISDEGLFSVSDIAAALSANGENQVHLEKGLDLGRSLYDATVVLFTSDNKVNKSRAWNNLKSTTQRFFNVRDAEAEAIALSYLTAVSEAM